MANTTIQIKRSSVTTQPASLAAAEPAYSYLSDKLFIGDATGSSVIAIGGKYFIDQLNVAFSVAKITCCLFSIQAMLSFSQGQGLGDVATDFVATL
jgi:hypothetical protein